MCLYLYMYELGESCEGCMSAVTLSSAVGWEKETKGKFCKMENFLGYKIKVKM